VPEDAKHDIEFLFVSHAGELVEAAPAERPPRTARRLSTAAQSPRLSRP